MRDAILWKCILNQGVESANSLVLPIIRSPIIVDTRPTDRQFDVYDFGKYSGGIAFPFQQFWVETEAATRDGLYHGWKGALVSVKHLKEDDIIPARTFFYKIGGEHIRFEVGTVLFKTWLIWCESGGRPHPVGYAICVANPDGTLPLDSTGGYRIAAPPAPENVHHLIISDIDDMLDTLLMLSCKNVSLAPHEMDETQCRIARKRVGGDATKYRYHTLVVRPPGARHDSPGIDIGIMPRHVCRGHYAEYGPMFGNGLLFGKYEGRFFVPPHMKGKKENGIVEKDYAVV